MKNETLHTSMLSYNFGGFSSYYKEPHHFARKFILSVFSTIACGGHQNQIQRKANIQHFFKDYTQTSLRITKLREILSSNSI